MDKGKIIEAAQLALGRPYKWGSKWDVKDDNPTGPIDCSGFVRWCFARGGKLIPDGSYAQYKISRPLGCAETPNPGDLGFFVRQGQPHHVGILEDSYWVLEARGNEYDRVIRRPRVKWESYREFSGWRRVDDNA